MIRQLIREMLLTERVYGAQAVVYHGSETDPDVLIPAFLNDTFEPGRGAGDMYGKGLYCVYDLHGTLTDAGKYGAYIYKFKINLYGFICFDPEVAQLVYKRPLTPVEQAQEIGLDKTLVEKLKGINVEGLEFTSDAALPASKFLKGKVKGLIFTGSRDGRVAVIYDQAIAIPVSYKEAGEKSWSLPVPASWVKPALRKTALDQWEAEKYDIEPANLLAKLSKLPADKRVVKGDLDLIDVRITSLPTDLQVVGDLDLSYSTTIASLPDGLKVGGNLILNGATIASLPADLQVGVSIVISNATIASLPDGLKVGWNLVLNGTKIASLPAGLKVGGDLFLRATGIRSLPYDLQVSGDIYNFSGDKSQVPQHLKDKLK